MTINEMSSRALREPLTHFFAIGLLLFALYGYLNRGAFDAPDEIIVDDARVAALQARFERTWQRPPNPSELRALVDNWVREEIMYREGLALRLDDDDPVVRRRIAQKMDFISDGLIAADVDDADLQTWLDTHPDDYRVPARYTLRQAYFDPGRHGASLPSTIEITRAALSSNDDDVTGDPTLLPERLENVSQQEIAGVFGSEFARALDELPAAEWTGPVVSTFGQHLVIVESKQAGRLPALDEVRAAVERDVLRARTVEADAALYEALRRKYTVNITANPPTADAKPGS